MNPPQPGIVGEPGGPTQVSNREEIEEQRIIETEVLETDDPQGHESDIDAQKEQKTTGREGQKGRGPKGCRNNNLLNIGSNEAYGKNSSEGLGGIGSDLLSGKGIVLTNNLLELRGPESPEQQQQQLPASSASSGLCSYLW